jgi:hypothetical protein
MKKLILLVLIFAMFIGAAGAQERDPLDEQNPAAIGASAAQQALSEVQVDLFERDGFWTANISPDNGLISTLLRSGGSAQKDPPPDQPEDAPEVTDTHVLGVKVEFIRRGIDTFYVTAGRPLPIEGEVKTVSVMVAGRNQPHTLSLVVQDYNGKKFELKMGTLDFSGWKKISVAIPPSPDGINGIVQASSGYSDKPGLRIVGFRVDCEPMYAKGSYFIYFDDLRAVTDLYAVQNRDTDDMQDDW